LEAHGDYFVDVLSWHFIRATEEISTRVSPEYNSRFLPLNQSVPRPKAQQVLVLGPFAVRISGMESTILIKVSIVFLDLSGQIPR
jgi:hypothetical protein